MRCSVLTSTQSGEEPAPSLVWTAVLFMQPVQNLHIRQITGLFQIVCKCCQVLLSFTFFFCPHPVKLESLKLQCQNVVHLNASVSDLVSSFCLVSLVVFATSPTTLPPSRAMDVEVPRLAVLLWNKFIYLSMPLTFIPFHNEFIL